MPANTPPLLSQNVIWRMRMAPLSIAILKNTHIMRVFLHNATVKRERQKEEYEQMGNWLGLLVIIFSVFLASTGVLNSLFPTTQADPMSLKFQAIEQMLHGWMSGSLGKLILLIALIIGAISLIGSRNGAKADVTGRSGSSGGSGSTGSGQTSSVGSKIISSMTPKSSSSKAGSQSLASSRPTGKSSSAHPLERTATCPSCKSESKHLSSSSESVKCPTCGEEFDPNHHK